MLRFDDRSYQLTSFKGVGNVWGYNTIQGKTSITQSDRISMSSEDQQHHDWHAPNGKIKTAPDEHWLHLRILMPHAHIHSPSFSSTYEQIMPDVANS